MPSMIWSEVLGVPVGPDDDFFELGGNSLFTVRIGAALRARGLPSLRLRKLYRHPPVRATAASLGASDVPRARAELTADGGDLAGVNRT